MIGKLRKAMRVARQGGIRGVVAAAREQAEAAQFEREYARWVEEYDTLDDEGRRELATRAVSMNGPMISILMPVYNPDERFLREALESVCGQIYPTWELCIADDASTEPHVRAVISEFAQRDARITPVFREKNGHISAASNSALAFAQGEFAVLMDHDDVLSEHALFYIAEAIGRDPNASLIYSDEDKVDADGRRFSPYFKPAWSPELFYSHNVVGHLAAYRTSILREIGGFREGFEGSQDYDLTLRYIEGIAADEIVHVPRVLYHWRAVPGSVAFDSGEKTYAHERARTAISEHFARRGENATVIRGTKETHRVQPTSGLNLKAAVIKFDGQGAGGFSEALRQGRETECDVLIFLLSGCRKFSNGWQEELSYLRCVMESVSSGV
jgi:O-antigen biosynthesis protein